MERKPKIRKALFIGLGGTGAMSLIELKKKSDIRSRPAAAGAAAVTAAATAAAVAAAWIGGCGDGCGKKN